MAKAKPSSGSEPVVSVEPDPMTESSVPEPTNAAEFVAPEVVVVPEPEPAVAPRRGGFVGHFVGGVVAAALGFAVALFAVPAGIDGGNANSILIAEQAAQIKALKSEVAALAAKPAADDPRIASMAEEISALKTAIQALPVADTKTDDRVAALEQRLTSIESMPTSGGGVSPAALVALQSELAALKAQVQSQAGAGAELVADVKAAAQAAEDQLAKAQAEALALQTQAQVTAAIGRVQSALDTGVPFAAALSELAAAGLAIPPALSDSAASGIPSLVTLQDGFGDAARAALEASLRANPGTGFVDRVGTFLRGQTGARSLTPREGTDPDAILSRAEAALGNADLAAVLSELATLPPEGQAAMADWVGLVQTRIAATDALTTLIGGQP
jgi:hypothetical protein